MSDRVARFAPFAGLVFAALALFVTLTEKVSPASSASGLSVLAFYKANHSEVKVSSFVFMVALVFLMFFAASLRKYFSSTKGSDGMSTLVLVGAALITAGFATLMGIEYALAESYNVIAASSAQVLNVLANELFFTVAIGSCIFGIAAGLAILRGAALPKWMGWVALALGLAAPTPASAIALYGLLAWVIVVSFLLYLRADSEAVPAPPASPVASATSGG